MSLYSNLNGYRMTIPIDEHRRGYIEAVGKAFRDGCFDGWFCSTKDNEYARVSGAWDFSRQILTDYVAVRMSDPHKRTCLEIGYGGGRLLLAASRHFGRAIGVDIHEHDLSDELSNCVLLNGDGETLPVESDSVDFVYSFIVLLHLAGFGQFKSYLQESKRVLKPGGVAQFFYKPCKKQNGYREYTAGPNHATLEVGADLFKEMAEESGFQIIDEGKSWRIFEGAPGGQAFITLQER